jgi:hypothetical protein
MRRIPSDQIPILPIKDIVNGESIAFGVGDYGVMIQFMDRDECIHIEWVDIIGFGVELLKVTTTKSEKEPEEIPTPTKVD